VAGGILTRQSSSVRLRAVKIWSLSATRCRARPRGERKQKLAQRPVEQPGIGDQHIRPPLAGPWGARCKPRGRAVVETLEPTANVQGSRCRRARREDNLVSGLTLRAWEHSELGVGPLGMRLWAELRDCVLPSGLMTTLPELKGPEQGLSPGCRSCADGAVSKVGRRRARGWLNAAAIGVETAGWLAAAY